MNTIYEVRALSQDGVLCKRLICINEMTLGLDLRNGLDDIGIGSVYQCDTLTNSPALPRSVDFRLGLVNILIHFTCPVAHSWPASQLHMRTWKRPSGCVSTYTGNKIKFLRRNNIRKKYIKQECIPVGCVPPACCPYLPACTAPGVPGPGDVPGPGGVPSPGGIPGPTGCTWSGGYLPRYSPPPHGQTDTCKNITFTNFVCGR